MALTGIKGLMVWCQRASEGYNDVKVVNMTTSFRDGLAFCAIIHHFRPDLIDFNSLSKENIWENNQLAFEVAEKELNIPALLDPDDMVAMTVPDKLSIMTYVSQYYNNFKNKKGAAELGIKPTAGVGRTTVKRPIEEVNSSQDKEGIIPAKKAFPANTCQVCGKKVYLVEKVVTNNKLYHRSCFKCNKCGDTLRPGAAKIGVDPSHIECQHHQDKIWNLRSNMSSRSKETENKKDGSVWESRGTPLQQKLPWKKNKQVTTDQSNKTSDVTPSPAKKPPIPDNLPSKVLHPHLGSQSSARAQFVIPEPDLQKPNSVDPNKEKDTKKEEELKKGLVTTLAGVMAREKRELNVEQSKEKRKSKESVIDEPPKTELPSKPPVTPNQKNEVKPSLPSTKPWETNKKNHTPTSVSQRIGLFSQNNNEKEVTKKKTVEKEEPIKEKVSKPEPKAENTEDDIADTKPIVSGKGGVLAMIDRMEVEKKDAQVSGEEGNWEALEGSEGSSQAGEEISEMEKKKYSSEDEKQDTEKLEKEDESEEEKLSNVSELKENVSGEEIKENVSGDEIKENVSGDEIKENGMGEEIKENVSGDEIKENGMGEEIKGSASDDDIEENGMGEEIKENGMGEEIKGSASGDDIEENGMGEEIKENGMGEEIKDNGMGVEIQENEINEEKEDEFDPDNPFFASEDETEEVGEEGEEGRQEKEKKMETEVSKDDRGEGKSETTVITRLGEMQDQNENISIVVVVKSDEHDESELEGGKDGESLAEGKDNVTKGTETEENIHVEKGEDKSAIDENKIVDNKEERTTNESATAAEDKKSEQSKDSDLDYNDSLNPFGSEDDEEDSSSGSDSDLGPNNPFAKSDDEDEKYDNSLNPFGDDDMSEDSNLNPFGDFDDDISEDSKLNPFTGSPVSDTSFEFSPKIKPPRPPPPKTSVAKKVVPKFKTREEILQEMQRARNTLKHKKRKAPNVPPVASPGSDGMSSPGQASLKTPPRSKKTRRAPMPPGIESGSIQKNDSDSSPTPTKKSLEATPDGSPVPSPRRGKSQKMSRPGFKPPPQPGSKMFKRRAPAPPPQKRDVSQHHVTPEEIQKEIAEIEQKTKQMEKKGIELEDKLRAEMKDDASEDSEELLMEWFEVVNEKNQLVRREGELVAQAQIQDLEIQHAEVEYEMRLLMHKQEHEKTDEDNQKEEELLELLIGLVQQRSTIVDRLEDDRIREQEEDETIRNMMQMKDKLLKNPRKLSKLFQQDFGLDRESIETKKEKKKRKKKKKHKDKVKEK